jgi:hypothetical protein
VAWIAVSALLAAPSSWNWGPNGRACTVIASLVHPLSRPLVDDAGNTPTPVYPQHPAADEDSKEHSRRMPWWAIALCIFLALFGCTLGALVLVRIPKRDAACMWRKDNQNGTVDTSNEQTSNARVESVSHRDTSRTVVLSNQGLISLEAANSIASTDPQSKHYNAGTPNMDKQFVLPVHVGHSPSTTAEPHAATGSQFDSEGNSGSSAQSPHSHGEKTDSTDSATMSSMMSTPRMPRPSIMQTTLPNEPFDTLQVCTQHRARSAPAGTDDNDTAVAAANRFQSDSLTPARDPDPWLSSNMNSRPLECELEEWSAKNSGFSRGFINNDESFLAPPHSLNHFGNGLSIISRVNGCPPAAESPKHSGDTSQLLVSPQAAERFAASLTHDLHITPHLPASADLEAVYQSSFHSDLLHEKPIQGLRRGRSAQQIQGDTRAHFGWTPPDGSSGYSSQPSTQHPHSGDLQTEALPEVDVNGEVRLHSSLQATSSRSLHEVLDSLHTAQRAHSRVAKHARRDSSPGSSQAESHSPLHCSSNTAQAATSMASQSSRISPPKFGRERTFSLNNPVYNPRPQFPMPMSSSIAQSSILGRSGAIHQQQSQLAQELTSSNFSFFDSLENAQLDYHSADASSVDGPDLESCPLPCPTEQACCSAPLTGTATEINDPLSDLHTNELPGASSRLSAALNPRGEGSFGAQGLTQTQTDSMGDTLFGTCVSQQDASNTGHNYNTGCSSNTESNEWSLTVDRSRELVSLADIRAQTLADGGTFMSTEHYQDHSYGGESESVAGGASQALVHMGTTEEITRVSGMTPAEAATAALTEDLTELLQTSTDGSGAIEGLEEDARQVTQQAREGTANTLETTNSPVESKQGVDNDDCESIRSLPHALQRSGPAAEGPTHGAAPTYVPQGDPTTVSHALIHRDALGSSSSSSWTRSHAYMEDTEDLFSKRILADVVGAYSSSSRLVSLEYFNISSELYPTADSSQNLPMVPRSSSAGLSAIRSDNNQYLMESNTSDLGSVSVGGMTHSGVTQNIPTYTPDDVFEGPQVQRSIEMDSGDTLNFGALGDEVLPESCGPMLWRSPPFVPTDQPAAPYDPVAPVAGAFELHHGSMDCERSDCSHDHAGPSSGTGFTCQTTATPAQRPSRLSFFNGVILAYSL